MGWMVERSPRFPAAAVLLCEVGLGGQDTWPRMRRGCYLSSGQRFSLPAGSGIFLAWCEVLKEAKGAGCAENLLFPHVLLAIEMGLY